jgi:hypothetical protein
MGQESRPLWKTLAENIAGNWASQLLLLAGGAMIPALIGVLGKSGGLWVVITATVSVTLFAVVVLGICADRISRWRAGKSFEAVNLGPFRVIHRLPLDIKNEYMRSLNEENEALKKEIQAQKELIQAQDRQIQNPPDRSLSAFSVSPAEQKSYRNEAIIMEAETLRDDLRKFAKLLRDRLREVEESQSIAESEEYDSMIIREFDENYYDRISDLTSKFSAKNMGKAVLWGVRLK